MTAEKALRDGDLTTALAELEREVRREPGQVKHRIFLFQLLCVLGQWERAMTQLKVAKEMAADAGVMASTYEQLIPCEAFRAEVFAGRRAPLLLGEPDPWMALVWEAQRLTAQGHHAKAQDLRNQAYEQVTPRSGALVRRPAPANTAAGEVPAKSDDDQPGERFEWIADADSRLGPILEAVVNGRYYWLPWDRIARIDFEPVADLRDLVWLPVHFEWTNAGEVVGFIPARYAGTEAAGDPLLKLSRKTDWVPQGDDVYFGLGQRMFVTDQDEVPLLSIQSLRFDPPSVANTDEAGADDAAEAGNSGA
ncbi:MAG TPA: type VI secretion system accessory protein TagJ [Pirellulaceae bacterium]|nr:type VI secretion system accessory protein TagJ [Pirellulaceae bacterium]